MHRRQLDHVRLRQPRVKHTNNVVREQHVVSVDLGDNAAPPAGSAPRLQPLNLLQFQFDWPVRRAWTRRPRIGVLQLDERHDALQATHGVRRALLANVLDPMDRTEQAQGGADRVAPEGCLGHACRLAAIAARLLVSLCRSAQVLQRSALGCSRMFVQFGLPAQPRHQWMPTCDAPVASRSVPP